QPTLLFQFVVSAFKHRHQRTGLELLRHGRYILQPAGFAKGALETGALCSGSIHEPEFLHDYRPRENAEEKESSENAFRNRPSLPEQVRNFATQYIGCE